jgi:hypothetical protein
VGSGVEISADRLTIEREKGFEPSTSTLARLHSTTELLPQWQGAFLATPWSAVKRDRATSTNPRQILPLPRILGAVAAWITIYMKSRKPVPGAATIHAELMSDWSTLGESIGLEEAEVDAFMTSLVWSDERVGEPDKRSLRLHVWNDPDRVRTELDEVANAPVALDGVTTVVALEFGISQLDTMLEVVGFEIAYWLAEHYDGVIKADNGSWFDHDAHRWDPST